MGYVAARGGHGAIEAAEQLVRSLRWAGRSNWLQVDQIVERLGLAVDRVQSEGGLWAPELAARALRQAEGDVIEAAQLLRTFRSTLPRFAYSQPIDADELRVLRRVVPAYRNPPGPQLLGRTVDYTGRLLELLPDEPSPAPSTETETAESALAESMSTAIDRHPARLLEVLRDADLVVDRRRADDPEPFDITRSAVRPPAARSARLATMARAETGALVNLWYRNILGPDSHLHEITLGEVRHGHLPVRIVHPITGGDVTIGRVRVTEIEAIEDLNGIDEDRTRLDVGYGMCFGHNERKAIAMANLDIAVERANSPALEQSILMTTDGLDASGFIEHLKLPHYVTFRSIVERKLAVRDALERSNEKEPVPQ
ncbi:MAG: carbon-phosphorus lyase complex subunit PhnI [Acidimicrobiia bacterium]